MIKPAPTHDQDLAEVVAYVEKDRPGFTPESSPIWWPFVGLMAIGDKNFPDHCRYLFSRPLSNVEMKERADRIENMAKFVTRDDEVPYGRD